MSESMRPLTDMEKQVLAYIRTHPGRTFEDCMKYFEQQGEQAYDLFQRETPANALAYLIANFYICRDDITNALTAAEWSMSHE